MLSDRQERLRQFAAARDWEQFHTPKNLVTALGVEASELAEIFQWLTPQESVDVMDDPVRAEAVRHEMADVLAYLLRVADVLDVDLEQALDDKIALNEQKYPVDLARGNATKYDKFER
jgi:NTP pyrophosphatase (non-canonical NTP hydrolase)